MKSKTENEYTHKMITIPNAMSVFRLLLIPLFVWLYCAKEEYWYAALVLFISGMTDIIDGWIARKFNMISEFGKALDPIADKLTQMAVLICLVTRFPMVLVLVILFVIKEFIMGITGLLVIRKTGRVYGADWHGKVNTFLLYLIIAIHVVWPAIPVALSDTLLCICFATMTASLVLYVMRNCRILKGKEA